METSRRRIAELLNVPPRTICFTSGGTEADNHAIQAAVGCLGVTRIVTSAAEHSAVIKASDVAGQMDRIEVVHVGHHADGTVDLDALANVLKASEAKTLVSPHARQQRSRRHGRPRQD